MIPMPVGTNYVSLKYDLRRWKTQGIAALEKRPVSALAPQSELNSI